MIKKKSKVLSNFTLIPSMPQTGIEPVREYKSRRILSPVRLPVPPLRHSALSCDGWRWIRTTESVANRFTVCPLWPLGNPSICQIYNLTIYVYIILFLEMQLFFYFLYLKIIAEFLSISKSSLPSFT